MAIGDVYYENKYDINHGLKIDDVVRIKYKPHFWGTSIGKDYIIDYICNGLITIKDFSRVLYLSSASNLICIGHIEKCIQFKDKSLRLI